MNASEMDLSRWKDRFAPLSQVRMPEAAKERVLAALDREAARLEPSPRVRRGRRTARNILWWAGSVAVAAAVVAVAVSGRFGGTPSQPGNPAPVSPASPGAGGPVVSVPLASVHMVSDQVGWASGQGGQVLRTEDGGATWHDVTPSGLQGARAAAGAAWLDADHAWLAVVPNADQPGSQPSPLVVYRTSDGGRTWQEAVTQETGGMGVQVQFLDTKTGYILLHLGVALSHEAVALLRTADGGATWQTVTPASSQSPLFPGDKTGFAFADVDTGYVTGYEPAPSILLYATHDGGQTWKQQELPIPQGYSAAGGAAESLPPQFFNARDGVLPVRFHQLGPPAVVFYVTHDGGRTWTPTTGVEVGQEGLQWSFADASHGFVSDGSVIYRTNDAGRHWTRVEPNVSLKGVSQLRFRTADEGWAIVDGRLLRTTDGGRTWEEPGRTGTAGASVPYAQIRFRSLFMVDDRVGWGAAQDGHPWRTQDGGATWVDVTPKDVPPPAPATTVLAPFFLAGSGDTAWVLDMRDDTAYRTTDGGAHWQKGQAPRLAIANDGAVDMSFLDADHGWLLVSSGGHNQVGELFETRDGGMTWSEVTKTGSGQAGSLPSGGRIAFSPTVKGLGWLRPDPEAAGYGPPLYETRDGGRTWQPASLPLPGNYANHPSSGQVYAYAGLPTFPRGGSGVMPVTLFSGKTNQAVYLTTTDGGLHWKASKPLNVGSTTWGTQTSWVDAQTGWVYAPDANTFYRTDDGGQSWKAVHPNVRFDPFDQVAVLHQFGFAPSGRMGWATTVDGALYFTYDGGQTWGAARARP